MIGASPLCFSSDETSIWSSSSSTSTSSSTTAVVSSRALVTMSSEEALDIASPSVVFSRVPRAAAAA